MSKWQLQDAKAQFSKLVDEALTDGPQQITRYGKDVAVLLSAEDFELMQRPQRRMDVEKIRRRLRRVKGKSLPDDGLR